MAPIGILGDHREGESENAHDADGLLAEPDEHRDHVVGGIGATSFDELDEVVDQLAKGARRGIDRLSGAGGHYRIGNVSSHVAS